MKQSHESNERNSVIRIGPILKSCVLAFALGLALAGSAVADVDVAARFASTTPVIDGHVTEEWLFSSVTTLRAGEIVMYTKNDAEFLYLLMDVRSDTSGAGLFYGLTFDVNQDRSVTYGRDFTFAPGIGVVGGSPVPFVKWYAEPPPLPGVPSIPMSSPVDPRSLGGFGVETADALEKGWPAHRVCEFRLSLAELGVRPEDLRLPLARVPTVRMRVKYSQLDDPFDPINEPSPGGPSGFDNMFLIRLAGASEYPTDTAGSIFQGVGLVPSGRIDAIHGTAFLNIPGWPYGPLSDAPFGGGLQIKVRFPASGANRYRVLYAKVGEPFRALRQTWTNLRLPAEDPVAFGPDAEGAYAIQPDIDSANAWYLPNLAMMWQSGQFDDGLYHLKLELTNTVTHVDHTPTGPSNSLTLRIVNTPPWVRIENIRYDSVDICECGFVTQGDAPRGFTFTISAVDTNGALGGVSFGGTWGNGRGMPAGHELGYSDSYTLDRDGARVWFGASNLVLRASDPWRAHRSCAYTFNLVASSRAQNGFSSLFSAQAFSSLTIIYGRGAGRTDCPPTTGADGPALSVHSGGGNVSVSWPLDFPEYRLQSTKNPADPGSWADWTDPVIVVGDEGFTAFPQGKPQEFFRLKEQP